VPTRGGRISERQTGATAVGAKDPLGDPCPDCGAWHGIHPLTHLTPDIPCNHERNRPCKICGARVGDLSFAGPDICAICAAARTKSGKTDNLRPEAPDLSTPPEPFLAGLEEAPHSSLRSHFGSRQIASGLVFAFFAFALGSAGGYGFGVYGPRWWPMMAEWSHLVSDFTIDHHAPAAERGGLATPKRLDGQIREDHLATLIAQCDRQIAEHRWGDALKTYQQVANEFPGNPAAAQLGKRLSAILWSEGASAVRANRPDDALMLFGMLELLPPVPAAAILADDLGEGPRRGSPGDETTGSAPLIEPAQTGSSIRPEATSRNSPKTSDGSREVAAATSAGHLPVPPPIPSSAQGRAPNEARMSQAFEQFLNGRQRAPTTSSERERLFAEFKNSLAAGFARTAVPTTVSKEATPEVEIWQALETTNLRELASAGSPAIGEVAKGSTFRVIGRSEDGRWLKIETRDGLTGYYWAARAREMR
jgi:SH3 domain-containing protein